MRNASTSRGAHGSLEVGDVKLGMVCIVEFAAEVGGRDCKCGSGTDRYTDLGPGDNTRSGLIRNYPSYKHRCVTARITRDPLCENQYVDKCMMMLHKRK
jgi:hypothetical protein